MKKIVSLVIVLFTTLILVSCTNELETSISNELKNNLKDPTSLEIIECKIIDTLTNNDYVKANLNRTITKVDSIIFTKNLNIEALNSSNYQSIKDIYREEIKFNNDMIELQTYPLINCINAINKNEFKTVYLVKTKYKALNGMGLIAPDEIKYFVSSDFKVIGKFEKSDNDYKIQCSLFKLIDKNSKEIKEIIKMQPKLKTILNK